MRGRGVDVQGLGQHPVPHRHDHLDDARDTGGRLGVPEVRLERAKPQWTVGRPVLAWYAPRGYPRFGALILGGILSIAAGLIAFFLPGITALGLLIMIAAWAIVIGFVEIFAAVQLRKVIRNEWLLILAGIASVG